MLLLTLIAQEIRNPVVPNLGSSEKTLAVYIGTLWQTLVILGGLAVIIEFLMGGFYWITSGGDKGKVDNAKQRFTQSATGLVVLAAVAAISIFFGKAMGFDLLRPVFPSLVGGGSGSASGGSGYSYSSTSGSGSSSGSSKSGSEDGSCADRNGNYTISNKEYVCRTLESKANPKGVCKQCVNGSYKDPEKNSSCPSACDGVEN